MYRVIIILNIVLKREVGVFATEFGLPLVREL